MSLGRMVTFVDETISELRARLDKTTDVGHGYVDALRLSITNKPSGRYHSRLDRKKDGGEGGTGSARDASAYDIQEFLRTAELREPSSAADADTSTVDDLIAVHLVQREKFNDRIATLLSHKLEKAGAGDVLVQEIDRVMKEFQSFALARRLLTGPARRHRLRGLLDRELPR
ncbi:hypothetical protein OBBRIDRAFT_890374 [Obba rivulosa]|uniref:Uncharacterized protein n=1 Tax=Obba rivulosa TaxID=1052685 RepID=A0A8E2AQM5_9APHY|nr:hypothetical protein OBBRIDRAFT_890374 [Obba rivulosa]